MKKLWILVFIILFSVTQTRVAEANWYLKIFVVENQEIFMDGDAGVVHRAGTPKALDQKKKYATFLKSSKAKSKANSLCAKSEYHLGRIQVRSSGTSYAGIGVLMFSKVLDFKSASRIQNTPTYDSSKRSALISEYGDDETKWPEYIQGGYVGYSIKYKCQNDGPVPSVPTYPAYQIYINGGALFSQLSYNQLKSWNWSVQITPRPKSTPTPTPTPTPTISDPNDKTPPVISDVVVPSTVKAGSSITATFRVRDDVGVKLITSNQPFVVAYLWQGAKQIDVPYALTKLVSGDVKDGNYSVTFTGTQGLSGNYQIKLGAYDGTSKSTEFISPDISIVP
jgi:hypothetical protein